MEAYHHESHVSSLGIERELSPWYGLCAILATLLPPVVMFTVLAGYNVFWHPLRGFPGPLLFRATGMAKAYYMVSGDLPFRVKAMHDIYGPVVRIAPNELSFISTSAWRDIYGSRSGGELSKYHSFYRVDDMAPQHIISADKGPHSMLRRLLAQGFSERSMLAQKPIIGAFVDLLMNRLRERASGDTEAVDLNRWFNFATFDIIGQLTFGSDFGNLKMGTWHPWVRSSAENNKTVGFIAAANGAGFGPLIKWCLRSGLLPRQDYLKELDEKVRRRIEHPGEHPDFIDGLLREKTRLSTEEIVANVEALIGAGSESTATLLSGTICALLQNPQQLARVTREVRSTFQCEEDITLFSVQRLDYMLACLNETFRYYPPVTHGMPRVTPKGGTTICGRWVPENTIVAIWQWAICHNAELWASPYTFRPERFMGNPDFAGDALEALQPFSVGTRNCIGRNLSYAETRLILARFIYNFDFQLADPSQDWFSRQKAYLVWDPPPLYVLLKPVVKRS